MLELAPKTVADLCVCEFAEDCVKNISEEAVINAYLISRNFRWVPAVIQLTALKGTAITVTENKIIVYGQKEPIELPISDSILRARLVDAFLQQRNGLYLSMRDENKVFKRSRGSRFRTLLRWVCGRNS
jgi:hypothetical protein